MKNLKIFRTFIWGCLSTNLLWGSFYIGVEGGYLRNYSVYSYEDHSNATTGSEQGYTKYVIGNGGIINLIFGTEHFFAKDYLGVRWGIFGGYGYTQSRGNSKELGNVDVNLSTLSAGANVDILVNFYVQEHLMAGFFVGAEYDFTLLHPNRAVEIGERKAQTYPKEDMLVGNKTHSNQIGARVGFSTLIAKHHRVELLAKVPLWTQSHSQYFVMPSTLNNGTKDDRKYTFKYRSIQALLGYKYVF